MKKSKRASKSFSTARRKAKGVRSFNTDAIWAVQCKECHKWRVVPTEEEYEEIRKNVTEVPFTCKRKDNISCNDAADLEFGSKHLWATDLPNLPKSPAGFKRKLMMRKDLTRLDCFYETPTGKKVRGPMELASFLDEHPEYKGVSLADFCFRAPKIAKDTIPMAVTGKKG